MGAVDLSVVVPCYDEESRLPGSLERIRRFLEARGSRFELILVDDGSSDGTAAVIRRAERELPFVRGVLLSPNRGKGRALAEGVKVSRGELVDATSGAPIADAEVIAESEEPVTEHSHGADRRGHGAALPFGLPEEGRSDRPEPTLCPSSTPVPLPSTSETTAPPW